MGRAWEDHVDSNCGNTDGWLYAGFVFCLATRIFFPSEIKWGNSMKKRRVGETERVGRGLNSICIYVRSNTETIFR